MPDDILTKIKALESQEYFTRMDEHKYLYALDKYKMKIDNKEVPDIINITLNDPQTFADYIIATLAGSIQQIEIEGDKLLTDQPEDIEELLNAVMECAGERLTNMEYPGLNQFDFSMACLRGRVARRITLRIKNGVFVPDILPIDTRFFVYEVGVDGLSLASYKMDKTPDQIRVIYPDFKGLSSLGDGVSELELRDVWTPKEHRIYVSGEPFIEPNPWGYVPFGVQICNTGNNLLDKDMRKYKGNSVYSGIADLYPELNRVVSILATLNVKVIQGNLQYKSREGTQANLPDESPLGLRTVLPVEVEGGYYPMPLEDIRQATTMLWNILEQRKQEATIASSKYGNLDFPLSAVAIAKLGSETDKILFPRIEAVANLNMKSARMMIDQLKRIGGTIEIGELGSFDTSCLNGKFKITYSYTQTSPQQDISNISIANSAKEFVSPDTIRRDYLKLQDPDGEKAKILIAKYEAVGADNMSDSELYQVIHDLRDVDRNVEAELALRSFEQRLKARNQPVMPTQQTTQGQQTTATPTGQQNANQNIIPLVDNSGNGRKATPKSVAEMN